jgi:hypothetical protein
MTDIAEIQLKIKAVEFALGSFADYENEGERRNFLRQNFTAIPPTLVSRRTSCRML